jgi:hypothetical protein
MATELRPGVFTELMAGLAAELEFRSAAAMVAVADAVVDEARRNLMAQSHAYGTPTPATPGGPPAMISGTLAGSVARTDAESNPLGVTVKVGTVAGQFPPYSGRTASSRYGYYLEIAGVGRSGVLYPWLMPAVESVGHTAALAALTAAFAGFGARL